jgi:hypothetical protein
VSFGPRPSRGHRVRGRWVRGRWGRGGWGRGGSVAILVVAVLLGGLGAALGLLVAHQDDTIHDLRAALRSARQPASVAAETGSQAALPAESGSALFTVPDSTGGSLAVVAAAVRPRPGEAALTWLYIYDRHAEPGARYGLLEGTCGGQYVTASDLADGTADRAGDLTIVAPNLPISARAADVWVLVYRWQDGVTLGGIQGPLIGNGARTFRSGPPC